MTALAPPAAAQVTKPATRSGGRSGSVAWMALPALLVFFAFAVVPLAGVLFLSFTTWDGIGVIHCGRLAEAGGRCSPTRAAARARGSRS